LSFMERDRENIGEVRDEVETSDCTVQKHVDFRVEEREVLVNVQAQSRGSCAAVPYSYQLF
jgi:hypothetical protein